MELNNSADKSLLNSLWVNKTTVVIEEDSQKVQTSETMEAMLTTEEINSNLQAMLILKLPLFSSEVFHTTQLERVLRITSDKLEKLHLLESSLIEKLAR